MKDVYDVDETMDNASWMKSARLANAAAVGDQEAEAELKQREEETLVVVGNSTD